MRRTTNAVLAATAISALLCQSAAAVQQVNDKVPVAQTSAKARQGCQTRACKQRTCRATCQRKLAARHKRSVIAPYRAWLEKTASCESGYGGPPNWDINTGNGFYGGLQFTVKSWRAVGGTGMPHTNGKLEQMYRGARLLRVQGKGAWPICGRH